MRAEEAVAVTLAHRAREEEDRRRAAEEARQALLKHPAHATGVFQADRLVHDAFSRIDMAAREGAFEVDWHPPEPFQPETMAHRAQMRGLVDTVALLLREQGFQAHGTIWPLSAGKGVAGRVAICWGPKILNALEVA